AGTGPAGCGEPLIPRAGAVGDAGAALRGLADASSMAPRGFACERVLDSLARHRATAALRRNFAWRGASNGPNTAAPPVRGAPSLSFQQDLQRGETMRNVRIGWLARGWALLLLATLAPMSALAADLPDFSALVDRYGPA